MSWVDASASAAATINPITTQNAESNIVFGNGFLTQPNDNNISPTSSTSAVAALGSAADTPGSVISSPAGGMSKTWLYVGIAGGVLLAGVVLIRYRKQIFL